MAEKERPAMELLIDQKGLPLNPFVEDLLMNLNITFIDTLKKTEGWEEMVLTIRRPR